MESTDIHVYFEMTVEIIAILTAVVGLVAWLNRQVTRKVASIAKDLDDKTRNIQSGYRNSGGSLTDLSHSLADLRRSNDMVHEVLGAKVDYLGVRLSDHLAQHDRRRADFGPPKGTDDRRKETP